MIVKELYLSPTTAIAEDFFKQEKGILRFFDYDYRDENVYINRKKELEQRTFNRDKLATVITSFHNRIGMKSAAEKNIAKLNKENSLIIVGGQQPGLLTGPMYSIYKAITVIQLAKEQEEKLGVPVIPLFWIAGEDHDLAEVNHVYIEGTANWKKHAVKQASHHFAPLTEKKIGQEEVDWVDAVFKSFKETAFTSDLQEIVKRLLQESDTYVTFFAKIMSWLFESEGLLFIDSGDTQFRALQSDVFEQLILQNELIHERFMTRTEQLESCGYPAPIEKTETNANLFLLEGKQRQRLDRSNGQFVTKNNSYSITELVTIAKETPERLSNNVVTRPIMQESMLPVLAFVAGPGEIAYWATLGDVFRSLNMKMPPIIPRLSATVVNRQIEKYLQEYKLNVKEVLLSGVNEQKETWLSTQKEWDVSTQSLEVKRVIENAHQMLRNLSVEIDPSFERLANKNLDIIIHQIEYLENKLETRIRQKYASELHKFDAVSHWLCPDNKRQERFFHVFFLLNLFGTDFISRIADTSFPLNEQHKLLYC